MKEPLRPSLIEVADRLHSARSHAAAIPPVRGLLPAGDIKAAYQVQQLNVRREINAGRRIVGRKIGLTSEAVQRQLGVGQPDFGVLFDSMAFRGDAVTVPLRGLIAPRIEAEIAFVLACDIPDGEIGRDALAQSVSHVAASAEIVDSAIAAWDINIVDTIADNASSGAFVLGSLQAFTADMDLPARRMTMRRDGEVVSQGSGAATLGDPLAALAWLARVAVEMGDPLRGGDVILAGALGAMTPFKPADYRIEIDGFPALSVRAAG